ncbi:adenosine deaminase-like [Tubulanus polymorphus]|uniref:adenosine deaminase-like n=1 Tax=Tubulanus polymorphus TaxID=672921 RepID=UPI003DA2B1C9
MLIKFISRCTVITGSKQLQAFNTPRSVSASVRVFSSLLRETQSAKLPPRHQRQPGRPLKHFRCQQVRNLFYSDREGNIHSSVTTAEMEDIKAKVELHVHLDGSIRPSTLWELSRQKNIPLPYTDDKELAKACIAQKPYSLDNFLKSFRLIVPAIYGDLDAIERISYEFCEDCSAQNIAYSEVRYSPQILTGPMRVNDIKENSVTAREVVQSVNRGLQRGSADFNVIVRSILCCIRPFPAWSEDVVDLCAEFRDSGVVGIDLAGNEPTHEHETDQRHINAFQKAKDLGIHRTVHAGENGPAAVVKEAIEVLHAERIGHGYHSVDVDSIYQLVRDRNVHIETCPCSSVVTGAVTEDLTKHPIIRFARDNVNYSISTDDPIITGKKIDDDYSVVINDMGLTVDEIIRTNLNAARSTFLPQTEKQELIERLEKFYSTETNDLKTAAAANITST